MKGQDYSELKAPDYFSGLTLEQFGDLNFIKGEPSEKDRFNARRGLDRMKEILVSNQYDLVVFDEINTSLHFHLVEVKDLLAVLDLKPLKTEVIMTGRYAPPEIIERADLVTEMREIKHYYNAGVLARTGIEK
jgi:cob(I)alamin adenosyltransferase